MLWFSPAHRYQRRLDHRIRLAYLIHEDLPLQARLRENLAYATQASVMSGDDEAHYERLLKRQPPAPLTRYLRAELLQWRSIRDRLRWLAERELLPPDYRKETTELRRRLDDLMTLDTIIRRALHGPLSTADEQTATRLLRQYT